MKKQSKSKYILPAAFAMLTGAAALASQALFSIASVRKSRLYKLPMRKSEPKQQDNPLVELVRSFKQRIDALDLPVISMRSRDGLMLRAHWYPAENAVRTLVLVHGWRSLWYRDFAGIADYLHETGANLLFIEQRAHGASEGDYISFGLMERFDVEDWVRMLPKITDVTKPVYLCGVSMGASTVLMASALELPSYVRGIVADCGYTSPAEIIRRLVERNTPLPAFFEKTAGFAHKLHTGYDYSAYSTLDAVRRSHIPTLFVHGEADTFVPAYMTRQNYAACAAPKELLLVPEAEHGLSFLVDREGYCEKLDWLFSHN